MPANVAMPAVRQNRSKLAPTCCQASSTIAAGTTPAAVVGFVMALLSFADSAPRAYRLKVGNAYLTFSTSTGTFPPSRIPIYLPGSRAGAERVGHVSAQDDSLGMGGTARTAITLSISRACYAATVRLAN